jgi:hypothetical protein
MQITARGQNFRHPLGDDPMQSAGLGQQLDQCREHRSIRPRQSRPPDLAPEHGNLMPEHQNLRVLRSWPPGQQYEPGYKLPEDQIEQSYRHGRRSFLMATVQRRRRSPPWMTYSAPTASKTGPSLHPPFKTEPPSDPGWFSSLWTGVGGQAARDSAAWCCDGVGLALRRSVFGE